MRDGDQEIDTVRRECCLLTKGVQVPTLLEMGLKASMSSVPHLMASSPFCPLTLNDLVGVCRLLRVNINSHLITLISHPKQIQSILAPLDMYCLMDDSRPNHKCG